ncbi:MAG TPA: helix-turn-helix domain-containing protein [Gemmatimonadaceae bacterium]
MHVVALLPRNLLSHLRLVLGDRHSLSTATDAAELDSMLREGDADLLVVDPTTRDGRSADAIEEIVARQRALAVIVYTTLAPTSMRLVVRLARLGVQHVVLNRFDDEPRRFLELIERVPAYPVAELMLQDLAPQLAALPIVLARAIEQLIRSPSRVKNGHELAALAGMTPRTLYRHLLPVGLSARHLIVCARLLRAYTFLRGPDSRLKEVALKLGYVDPGILSEQLRDWTGCAPRDIRRLFPPAKFVRLLADHLRRADATEEDAVEPV